MSSVPTLKVAAPELASGFKILNRSEYHPDVHTLFVDSGEKPMDAHARRKLDKHARENVVRMHPAEEALGIPTLRVKSDDTALGYVIINRSDFNADEHDLHESETPSAPTAEEIARHAKRNADGMTNLTTGRGRVAREPNVDATTGLPLPPAA